MIKYPRGTRVLVEVPAVIDEDGDAEIGEAGAAGCGVFTTGDTVYVGASALQRLSVRVAPVEILPGKVYRAGGALYLGRPDDRVIDSAGRLYGHRDRALPAGLVEVGVTA